MHDTNNKRYLFGEWPKHIDKDALIGVGNSMYSAYYCSDNVENDVSHDVGAEKSETTIVSKGSK